MVSEASLREAYEEILRLRMKVAAKEMRLATKLHKALQGTSRPVNVGLTKRPRGRPRKPA